MKPFALAHIIVSLSGKKLAFRKIPTLRERPSNDSEFTRGRCGGTVVKIIKRF